MKLQLSSFHRRVGICQNRALLPLFFFQWDDFRASDWMTAFSTHFRRHQSTSARQLRPRAHRSLAGNVVLLQPQLPYLFISRFVSRLWRDWVEPGWADVFLMQTAINDNLYIFYFSWKITQITWCRRGKKRSVRKIITMLQDSHFII